MKLKKKWIIIIGFIVAAGFIAHGLLAGRGDGAGKYNLSAVRRGNISQEVIVTGRVKPASSVDLAFERSGRITGAFIKVGNFVSAGQVLATLDSAILSAQLSQARANLAAARAGLAILAAVKEREQAKLSGLLRGAGAEEIAVAQARVESARIALADSRINLEQVTNKVATDLVSTYEGIKDVLRDAIAKVDDAVSRQADQLFTGGSSSASPQLVFDTTNPQIKNDVEWQRLLVRAELSKMRTLSIPPTIQLSGLEEALENTRKVLLVIRDFLQRANDAVADAINLPATVADSYRFSVTTALNNINAVLTAANSQQQKIAAQKVAGQNALAGAEAKVNEAKNNLAVAEAELARASVPARVEEITAQRAVLKEADANLSRARARIAEAEAQAAVIASEMAQFSLVAPLAGLVTAMEARVGEIAVPNAPVATVITDAKFEIEANVPEADIGKIKVGDTATVTLDAYGNDTAFAARVIGLEPAETVVEGVSTYKTRLQFEKDDERIKSGLTANVMILSGKRENVLLIPQRAIVNRDNKKFVRVLTGARASVREQEIQVGLKGNDGNIEIIKGLQDGELVIVGEKEEE